MIIDSNDKLRCKSYVGDTITKSYKSQSKLSLLSLDVGSLQVHTEKCIRLMDENFEYRIYDKKLDIRLWTSIYYPLISTFKQNTSAASNNINENYDLTLKIAFRFYSTLLKLLFRSLPTCKKPLDSVLGRTLLMLGDISRYAMDIDERCNGAHKCADISVCDHNLTQDQLLAMFQYKCVTSTMYYSYAASIIPESARPFHKLAVLSSRKKDNILLTLRYLQEALIRSNQTKEEGVQDIGLLIERLYSHCVKTLPKATTKCFELKVVIYIWDLYSERFDNLEAAANEISEMTVVGNTMLIAKQALQPKYFKRRASGYALKLLDKLNQRQQHEESNESNMDSFLETFNSLTIEQILDKDKELANLVALKSQTTKTNTIATGSNEPVYLVFDTNELINRPQRLLNRLTNRKFTVVIPNIVLNELSGLAYNDNERATNALQWLNSIKYETIESKQLTSGLTNNDDKIIQACVDFKDQAKQGRVFLITRDRVMTIKASRSDIYCTTLEDLVVKTTK